MKKEITIFVTSEKEEDLPVYTTEGASGADVRAKIESEITLLPGRSVLIPTGLFFELPEGYEIQVRPRSGLALKHGLTVLNSPGTLDSDYRGELKIILMNHGHENFVITPGMRIAQLVLSPVLRARFCRKEELAASCRGVNGFGHTGAH